MRILLIEDNPGDAELIKKTLARVFDCHTIEANIRLRDALERPDLHLFDVILTDLTLPDSTGVNSVRRLKEVVSEVPVIVLTSLAHRSVSLDSIGQGAQDFLVKDHIDPERLERSIRYAVQRQRMLVENETLLRHLQESKLALEQKNQRLERLCNTAQEFVDNVSHEFRTPLSVIMEYASLLRDGIPGEVNDEQCRLLNVIDDRVCDLNTMVDDMLDVSKLESGLLGAWRKECRITEIVDRTLRVLHRKAEFRGVSLSSDVPDELPLVYCDDEKIGRVIINLVVNAIKFSRSNGNVRIWVERAGDFELRLGVSDDGPGIPSDRLRDIFERFSQLNTELHQSNKGFGLGLNIAQELVQLNFGQMQVESELNVGTTFSFTIPTADPEQVTRRYLARLAYTNDAADSVSVMRVSVDEDDAETSLRDIDAFLHTLVRQNDLVLRSSPNNWLVLVATPEFEIEHFEGRLLKEHRDASRNRPRGPLAKLTTVVEGTWSIDRVDQVCECVNRWLGQWELHHV